MLKKIKNIIGLREDVENILEEINMALMEEYGVCFTIGAGYDGPTATWHSNGSHETENIMREAARMLRYHLDIDAQAYP